MCPLSRPSLALLRTLLVGPTSSRRVWIDCFAPGSPTPPPHPTTFLGPFQAAAAKLRRSGPCPEARAELNCANSTARRPERVWTPFQSRHLPQRWGRQNHQPSTSTSNVLCKCGTQLRQGLAASVPDLAPRQHTRTETCANGSCAKFPCLVPHLSLLPERHAAARGHVRTAVSGSPLAPWNPGSLGLPLLLARRPARRPRAAVPARSRPGLRRSLPRASLRVPPRPHRLEPGTSPETDGEAEPHSLSFRATHSRGPAPGLRVPARALTHGPTSFCPASPDQRPWTSGTRRARMAKFSQPLLSSRRRGELQPHPTQRSGSRGSQNL